MKTMKKWLGVVALAAAFASVGSAVEPPAATAYNVWWHNGAWVHQHTRTFPVYRAELGWSWWGSASGIAEAEWDGNTLLALPYTECHACSRIHIQAGDYGQTGWLGLSSVEGPYDAAR